MCIEVYFIIMSLFLRERKRTFANIVMLEIGDVNEIFGAVYGAL